MEKVYDLIEYYYDTYSYLGFSESRRTLFKTKEGAETYAKVNKLNIVQYCSNPGQEATIEERFINP